jgi:hypothetical protein
VRARTDARPSTGTTQGNIGPLADALFDYVCDVDPEARGSWAVADGVAVRVREAAHVDL